MIRELSRSRLTWDALILALIVVSCLLVAYQFAFGQAEASWSISALILSRPTGNEALRSSTGGSVRGVMAGACSPSTLSPPFLLT
jgi:hypothetical protein